MNPLTSFALCEYFNIVRRLVFILRRFKVHFVLQSLLAVADNIFCLFRKRSNFSGRVFMSRTQSSLQKIGTFRFNVCL